MIGAAAVCQVAAIDDTATGCYLGAYIQRDPVVNGDITAFEDRVGKQHASYCRYVGYGRPFPFKWANKLKRLGAVPHIAWEPNDGLAPVKNNEYLQGWVQACRHYQAPVIIRFASEMNGDWEAWSGDPDLFVKKWRLVYEAFQSAPNAIFVWCPFATPKSTIPLYYPGDAYVDWVGVNMYSVVFHSGRIDRPATDNPLAHLQFIYDIYSDNSPIAICEYAATHRCGVAETDTVEFAIEQMQRLYNALETRFPKVRFINWFSVDALHQGLAENNYAVTSNKQVLDAYRSVIADDYFRGRMPTKTEPVPDVPPKPPQKTDKMAAVPAISSNPEDKSQRRADHERSPEWRPGELKPPLWLRNTTGNTKPAGHRSDKTPPAKNRASDTPDTPNAPQSKPLTTEIPLAHTPGTSPPPDGIVLIVKGGRPDRITGQVLVEAVVGELVRPYSVVLKLDGRFQSIATTPAYFFRWNTENVSAGEHHIRAIARDATGAPIAEAEAAVIVAPE